MYSKTYVFAISYIYVVSYCVVDFVPMHMHVWVTSFDSPGCRDMYGGWGEKAQQTFNHTSRRLAVGSTSSEAGVRQDMYGRLSLTLVRENARAILARYSWPAS